VLWFTCQRECCKYKERGSSESSDSERRRRQQDPRYYDYWQKLLDVEESTAAFLTAIATLVEDCAEITLQLYIIFGHGVQENTIGLSIRYAYAALLVSCKIATTTDCN